MGFFPLNGDLLSATRPNGQTRVWPRVGGAEVHGALSRK